MDDVGSPSNSLGQSSTSTIITPTTKEKDTERSDMDGRYEHLHGNRPSDSSGIILLFILYAVH